MSDAIYTAVQSIICGVWAGIERRVDLNSWFDNVSCREEKLPRERDDIREFATYPRLICMQSSRVICIPRELG